MQVETDRSSSLPIRDSMQPGRLARPDQMAMFARITSYPPLGQMTCLRRSQLSFSERAVRLTIRHAIPTPLPQNTLLFRVSFLEC